jgi:DNA-binding CsgD family transcriptional regulator/tetratricopeptide (TPR) repeat protein
MQLLERDQELSLLARWHDATPSDGGCAVLISGEAGIGKTALVREFVRRRAAAARVLWGSCDPLSTPQALGPLRDVSRQVGGSLRAAVTEGTSRERIFTAVLDELERSGERGSVLVLEDVHWADEATLDLLRYLARRIARTKAMLIATYRSDELDARHPLQVALGHLPADVLRRLSLPSLSRDAVAQLAASAGRTAAGLHAATDGNPFYVTEVLAAPPGEVPLSVREATIARIARLSRAARGVAELAALVPGRVEGWLLQEVLNAPDAIIDECLLSGMTRDEHGALAFRHELSRQAVRDSLAPAEARSLHGRILSVLAAREGSALAESRLVHHAVGAGDAEAILRFAPLAAERAAGVGAHRESIAHYRSALDHGARLEPTARASLLDKLAFECFLTGRIDEAIAIRTHALEIWTTKGQSLRAGDALRWLSRLAWWMGRSGDAERFATQAMNTLEPLGVSNELAMAYSNKSQLAMLGAHLDSAIEWGEKAIEMARQLGNPEIEAHALNNVGMARMRDVGDPGWEEVEQSLQISLRHGLQDHVARAHTNMCTNAVLRRNYGAATFHAEACFAYCAEHELDTAVWYVRAFHSRMLLEQAEWDLALEEAEHVLRQPNIFAAARIPALVVVARVRTRRGADDAEGPLDEARRLALETREPQRIVPVAVACAELAWLRGDRDTVAREVHGALDDAARQKNPWVLGEIVFWSSRSSDRIRVSEPIAEPYQAQMDGDYPAAASMWAALGCRYEEADALADSRDEGHRRRALQIFEELGARPMAWRVRKQLQSEGVRGLKRGAHRATRVNPAGLTKRELQVLKLVVANLSNVAIARKLFVSARTVDHHTGAILAKLGISSRHEAAAVARKLGIDVGKR